MNLSKLKLSFVIVVLLSLLPLYSLLHPGLPLTHDGQDHVARVANFYQSLTEGNVIPRWAGNLNWGYGHPILMFLYPASSYFASFFHLLGFSFVDSTKLVFAFAFILSGITMYLWLRELLGEYEAAVGSIVYNFAPYRFVDLYVRGAIGEHMAFIFPPLILFFLLKLSKHNTFNRFYFVGGSLSIAGLLLSHNALALMFLPFIAIYAIALIMISKAKKLLITSYLLLSVLGVGLSSFFLLPAFNEGKYTLRDIVTEGVALSRFVNFKDLIYSAWNFGQSGEFSVQVGVVLWLSLLLSVFSVYKFFKLKRKIYLFIIATVVCFIISIFLMLPLSKFVWESFSILQKFQFPWRFLSITVLAGAILSAFLIASLSNKKLKLAASIIIISIAIFTTIGFWKPQSYLQKEETFYSGIYNGTTDTGESSPLWSVRFMEKKPNDTFEIIYGDATIEKLTRTSTHHSYKVNVVRNTRFRENTLYFPGWKVYIDGKENKGIQFQDSQNRGLITFFVPAGSHIIDVKFEDTRLRQVSNIISLISISLLILIMFVKFKKLKI